MNDNSRWKTWQKEEERLAEDLRSYLIALIEKGCKECEGFFESGACDHMMEKRESRFAPRIRGHIKSLDSIISGSE